MVRKSVGTTVDVSIVMSFTEWSVNLVRLRQDIRTAIQNDAFDIDGLNFVAAASDKITASGTQGHNHFL